MFYNRLGGGAGSAKELLNASGSKIADLESRGSGKVSVIGGLGNTPPEKVLQGSIYSDESGVRRTGTMEDITPDLNAQSDLIKEIRAMLVGRVTEANATPEDILKGKKAYVGEKLIEGTLSLNPIKADVSLSKPPYEILASSAVEFNNELHIFGGINNQKVHYKWNGSKWADEPQLAQTFMYGQAVVLNNEIHLLGGLNSAYDKNHYVLRGSNWTVASTLPIAFYKSSAVVLNNEIHILGGNETRKAHYKWNGSKWTSASTPPVYLYEKRAVVLNNEIHILGGQDNPTSHYKWNGSKWTSVSTLPYNFYGSPIALNGEIHLIGGDSSNPNVHYKWDGASWIQLPNVTIDLSISGLLAVYKNVIHLAEGYTFLALQKTLYERG